MTTGTPGRVPGRSRSGLLDMMRTAAVTCVIAVHLFIATKPTFNGRTHDFLYLGSLAVTCFFVLSGLLLTRSFLHAILGERPFPSALTYLRRRFWRIVPIYEVVIAFACVMQRLRTGAWPPSGDMLAHAFFLQSLSRTTSQTIDGPVWTMTVNMQFFLAVPLVAGGLWFVTRVLGRRTKAVVIGAFLASIVALSLAYRFVIYDRFADLTVGNAAFVFVSDMPGVMGAFAIGTGIALWDILTRDRHPSKAQATVALVLAAALFVFVSRQYIAHAGIVDAHNVLIGTFNSLLYATLVTLVIYAVPAFEGALRFCSAKIFAVVANLSYGIYLTHIPVLMLVERLLRYPTGTGATMLVGAISVPLIVLLSWFLSERVEKPLRALR